MKEEYIRNVETAETQKYVPKRLLGTKPINDSFDGWLGYKRDHIERERL